MLLTTTTLMLLPTTNSMTMTNDYARFGPT